MAKNPDTVHKFLGDLSSKVRSLWDDEQKVMMDMKKAEAAELGFEFSGKLDFWDFRLDLHDSQLTFADTLFCIDITWPWLRRSSMLLIRKS